MEKTDAVAWYWPLTRRGMLLVVLAEAVCIAVFIYLLARGRTALAAGVLLAPFVLLLWLAAVSDGFRLIWSLAVVLPLAVLELLPRGVYMYVLFPLPLIWYVSTLLPPRRCSVAPAARSSRLFRLAAPAFSAWVALSCLHSGLAGLARGADLRGVVVNSTLVVAAVAAGYLCYSVPTDVSDVRRWLNAAVAACLLAIAVLFVLPSPVGEGGLLGGKALVTPFGVANLNAFATFLAVVAAVVLGLLIDAETVGRRLLLALALLVMLVGLVATKSRGAWLGFGIAYLYVLIRSRSPALLVTALVGVLVLMSVDAVRTAVLVRVGETSARDPSLSGRYLLWLYGIKVFLQNRVFGVGMNHFHIAKHAYGFPAPRWFALRYNTHNLYVELLADIGAVGLFLYGWLYLVAFKRLNARRFRTARANPGVALGLGGGLVAFAVHGFWDALIWHPAVILFVGVLVGLSLAVARLGDTPAASDLRTGRPA